MKDYRELPKLRDSISYIYVEHAVVEQDDYSIVVIKGRERVPIPVASTTCLLIGPGTSVTHAALKVMSDNGCMAIWCGENMQKFYSAGMGETRSAHNLLYQAKLCMNEKTHIEVAKRMYERRFPKLPERDYTLQQLRGMEGIRVREAYKTASDITGIKWNGRSYKTEAWDNSDQINKALSAGNSILYAVCQAAIVSLGFSTGLGFVHTGKMLSFVYDIADLYKAETTIPAAFESVKVGGPDLLKTVREVNRKYFTSIGLLKRIPEDIAWVLDVEIPECAQEAEVGDLWEPEGPIAGGYNCAQEDFI